MFKLCIALFLTINLFIRGINSFLVKDKDIRQFAYLTIISYIILVNSVLLDTILVIRRFIQEKKLEKSGEKHAELHFEKSHFMLRLSICMTKTAYPSAFLITFVYYGALYTYDYNFLDIYTDAAAHVFQVKIILFK